MTARAVVFGIGNVLELSEENYVFDERAAGLGLTSAEFAERTQAAWDGDGIDHSRHLRQISAAQIRHKSDSNGQNGDRNLTEDNL